MRAAAARLSRWRCGWVRPPTSTPPPPDLVRPSITYSRCSVSPRPWPRPPSRAWLTGVPPPSTRLPSRGHPFRPRALRLTSARRATSHPSTGAPRPRRSSSRCSPHRPSPSSCGRPWRAGESGTLGCSRSTPPSLSVSRATRSGSTPGRTWCTPTPCTFHDVRPKACRETAIAAYNPSIVEMLPTTSVIIRPGAQLIWCAMCRTGQLGLSRRLPHQPRRILRGAPQRRGLGAGVCVQPD